MINVEISFSMIITTNKLISQEGKVCLFFALLSLHYCGTETGFNHRAAENGRSSAALFAAFTVADCNVCSVLSTSTQSGIAYFYIFFEN